MITELEIRTFWFDRKERSADCACRLLSMLGELAGLSPAFDRWVQPVETEISPRVPAWEMPLRLDDLTIEIQKRQAMREMPHEPWPELGYMLHAWNGAVHPSSIALDIYAGGYGRKGLNNQATLSLSPPMAGNEELTSFKTVSQALLTTARNWDALWGVVAYTGYRPPSSQTAGRAFIWPFGGWMTYLSSSLATGFVPPPAIMAERLPDGALLLIATEETFDPANPAHVASADAIDHALAPVRQSAGP